MATHSAKFSIIGEDRTKAAVVSAKRGFSQLATQARSLGGQLGNLVGLGGTSAFVGMAHSAIQAGSAITDMATATRTGVVELQVLTALADDAGASHEQLKNALIRVQKSAIDASNGLSTQVRAFEALNINVDKFRELTPERQMETLAVAMGEAEDQTTAYAAAMDILGTRNAPKLLEVLKRLGTEGFDELQDQVIESGRVMEKEVAESLDRSADVIAAWKRKIQTSIGRIVVDFSSETGRQILALQLLKVAGKFGLKIVDALDYAGQFAGAVLSAGFGLAVDSLRNGLLTAAEAFIRVLNKAPFIDISTAGIDRLRVQNVNFQDRVTEAIAGIEPPDRAGQFAEKMQEQIDVLRAIQKEELQAAAATNEATDAFKEQAAEILANVEAQEQLTEVTEEAAAATTKTIDATVAATKTMTTQTQSFFDVLADGLQQGINSWQDLARVALTAIQQIINKQKSIGGGLPGVSIGGGGISGIGGMIGFAQGGSFTVGGTGGIDSSLVAFKATPGERVTVQTPAQQAAGGGSITINQTIVAAPGMNEAAVARKAASMAAQMIGETFRRQPRAFASA